MLRPYAFRIAFPSGADRPADKLAPRGGTTSSWASGTTTSTGRGGATVWRSICAGPSSRCPSGSPSSSSGRQGPRAPRHGPGGRRLAARRARLRLPASGGSGRVRRADPPGDAYFDRRGGCPAPAADREGARAFARGRRTCPVDARRSPSRPDYRERAMHELGSSRPRRWRAHVVAASAPFLIAAAVGGGTPDDGDSGSNPASR